MHYENRTDLEFDVTEKTQMSKTQKSKVCDKHSLPVKNAVICNSLVTKHFL